MTNSNSIQKEKILFIVNPKSGVKRVKEIQSTIHAYLDQDKYDYEIVYTEYKGHGKELALEALNEAIDIIVAVGGDGSLNDIIQSIAYKEVKLGIWPMGSGNGAARTMNIPFDGKALMEMINKGKLTEVDLGRVAGQYFISNFGLGFDAEVTKDFEKSKSRGFLSYVWIITKLLPRYRSKKIKMKVGGHTTFKGKVFIFNAANMKQLGYGFEISPQASWNDAYFNVTIIKPFHFILAPYVAFMAWIKRLDKLSMVEMTMVKDFTLTDFKVDYIQFDGEYIPLDKVYQKELKVEMKAKALKIIIL